MFGWQKRLQYNYFSVNQLKITNWLYCYGLFSFADVWDDLFNSVGINNFTSNLIYLKY